VIWKVPFLTAAREWNEAADKWNFVARVWIYIEFGAACPDRAIFASQLFDMQGRSPYGVCSPKRYFDICIILIVTVEEIGF
jgi:hypothetical protein